MTLALYENKSLAFINLFKGKRYVFRFLWTLMSAHGAGLLYRFLSWYGPFSEALANRMSGAAAVAAMAKWRRT